MRAAARSADVCMGDVRGRVRRVIQSDMNRALRPRSCAGGGAATAGDVRVVRPIMP